MKRDVGKYDASLEEPVAEALLLLGALAQSREVTEDLVRAWVLALTADGIEPEQIEPTVVKILGSQRFFPSPVDFLEVARTVPTTRPRPQPAKATDWDDLTRSPTPEEREAAEQRKRQIAERREAQLTKMEKEYPWVRRMKRGSEGNPGA